MKGTKASVSITNSHKVKVLFPALLRRYTPLQIKYRGITIPISFQLITVHNLFTAFRFHSIKDHVTATSTATPFPRKIRINEA